MSESKEDSKTKDSFDLNLLDGATCPITLCLMNDPVILLGDGQTYERSAIESWLEQGHKTSPLSGAELSNFQTIPNYAMKSTINQLRNRFSSTELKKMEEQVKPKLIRKSSKLEVPQPSAPSAPNDLYYRFFTSSSSSSAPSAPSLPYPSFEGENYMNKYDESKEKDFGTHTKDESKEKDFDTHTKEGKEANGSLLYDRYALILAGGYGSGHVNDMSGVFETYVNGNDTFDVWTRKHVQEIPGPETTAVSLSGTQLMTGAGLRARIWAMDRTENEQEIAKNKDVSRYMKRLFNKYILSEEELAERRRKEELQERETELERLRLEEESIAYPFNDPSWHWTMEAELSGHREKICCTSIAHNNTFAVSGGLDGRIIVWHPKVYDDNSTWTCKHNMFHGDEESPVRAVEIHGANSLENHVPEWYATGGDDWAIRVWDCVQPDRMISEYNFSAHTLPVSCLTSASYGHHMLASSCEDGRLFLWSPKSGSSSPIVEFKDAGGSDEYFTMNSAKAHDGAIRSLAVDASYGGEGPRWIATGGEDGYLKIWDTRMNRLLDVLACPSREGLENIRKKHLPWLYEGGKEPLQLSDLKLKNSFYDNSSWEGVEVSNKDYIKVLKSSPDGRFLIRVDGTNEVAIYNTSTWQEVTAFQTDMRQIHDCSFAILNKHY